MSRDSIELLRLRGAEDAMGAVYRSQDARKAKFRGAAEQAPFMIRTLGLGSGIASLAAKEGERLQLAAMLARWLLQGCAHSPWRDADAAFQEDADWVKALLGKVAASDRATYRVAQVEALGYAGWVKRLAQAFCPK